jgi:predicted metal-dependent phosphoesterase TrpH
MSLQLDLHIHSRHSWDSLLDPKKILKIAEKRGLNIIAITDHNTINGALDALKEKQKLESQIEVIVGAEIQTNAGDIVGLFLNEEITSREIGDVIDEIHDQGGVVLLPHPLKGHKMPIIKTVLKDIDLVELLNSRTRQNMEDNLLIKGFGKRLVSCSDAHVGQEIGLCRTLAKFSSSFDEIANGKDFLSRTSIISLKGTFSPPYLHSYSDLVRSLRQKQYRQVPMFALQIGRQMVPKV